MNTVLKFDRVILIKELNEKIKKIGDAFEIANILEDSFLLREAKTRIAVGVISFEDFDKHFVSEENFAGWTQWQPFAGYDGQTDCFYRTNRKKVQVKFLTDKVRAEASCCKKDEFSLHFGIQLAYLRCLKKAMNKKIYELQDEAHKIQKEIYRLDKEIYDINQAEKKIINSLSD